MSSRLPEFRNQYGKISEVIAQIVDRKLHSHSLEELAGDLHVSPGYLQKLFTEWAGITPKQFGRYLSLQYSKGLLEGKNSMLDIAHKTGLSGAGRLHDLFVDMEAMTPGEYRGLGGGLAISYSTFDTQFGLCLVASTFRGICCILFGESVNDLLTDLESRFPAAKIGEKNAESHAEIQKYFNQLSSASAAAAGSVPKIKLHLHGTNFQIQVWQALLSIPEGAASTYGKIATKLGDKNLSRAVGTAIGKNPIGYIIPCHRVLKSTGEIGGYRWGPERKRAMLGFEASRREKGLQ
ncbi:MAG TPA: methylated-DNA--[protein]-cysteine S-methyltransferase [Candidatus Paceibacterota bacterium]